MVEQLVVCLLALPEVEQIIVTCNVPELLTLPTDNRLTLIHNAQPIGFAANHNKAFSHCGSRYFCPLNPDIELPSNPFPALLEAMRTTGAAIVAPLVRNSAGKIEDNFRAFPTLRSLCLKALNLSDGRHHSTNQSLFHPDWVAGMFMLIDRFAFNRLGGFDSRYYLYYEDVDICVRTWRAGMKVLACPKVVVIHDAQRASRREFHHFFWHLQSLLRYLIKYWGKLPNVQRLPA